MTTTRQFTLLAFLLFAVALGIRLLDLSFLAASPYWIPESGDARFYEDWALRILGGEWTDGAAFYGLPGYPYLLAGLYAAFGKDPFLVSCLQAALDACTASLVFLITFRALNGSLPEDHDPTTQGASSEAAVTRVGSTIASVCAALGYALLQPAQAFSIILMPTALAVFAFWLLVWAAMRLAPHTRHLPWVSLACGVTIGITSTAVGTMMALAPLLFLQFFRLAGTTWSKRLALPSPARGGDLYGSCPLLAAQPLRRA